MSICLRTSVIQCVELAAKRTSTAVRANLSRGVTSLASIAATAPFIGFFGTVVGIMYSFPAIGTPKSTAIAAVTTRLSNAMAPGILGLFVAVVAFWFHQYLRNQLEAFDVQMENAALDLVSCLVLHLERLRTADPALWSALTRTRGRASFCVDASIDARPDGPRLSLERMYRHGVLELIWPRIQSDLDAQVILDAAAWVCYGGGILGSLAYWMQQRLLAGFVVLAFFAIAGTGVRRGSLRALVSTYAFLLTMVCASILFYRFTFNSLCAAMVLLSLNGSLRAILWHTRANRTGRTLLGVGWTLLLVVLATGIASAIFFGPILGIGCIDL